MIYEFDCEDTLVEIKENFSKIIDLSNSLADNTSEYRKFYEEIGLNFNIAKESIKKSEYSLLIDCYTFSEKLLKNTIYHCLEFRTNSNGYINNFMSKKLDPEKFSPNPQFKSFEEELKSLNSDFKFVLHKEFSKIRSYDSMIKSRHRYAHANVYPVDIRNSGEDLLEVFEYLSWECNMFLKNAQRHIELEKLFKCIILDSQKLKKISSEKKIRYLSTNEKYRIDVMNFRKNVRVFNSSYSKEISELKIFNSILDKFLEIDRLNFNVNNGKELAKICKELGNTLI